MQYEEAFALIALACLAGYGILRRTSCKVLVRRCRRRLTIVTSIVALAGLSAFAGQAVAHTIGSGQYVYRTGDLCTRSISTMWHDNGNPRLAVGTEAAQGSFGVGGFNLDCVNAFTRPAGYIALHWTLFKWGPAQNAWLNCSSAGWFFNGSPNWQISRGNSWGSKPCGSGYYGVMADSFVWNGGWYGGGNWSGYEYL